MTTVLWSAEPAAHKGDRTVPIIEVHIAEGRSMEAKNKFVRQVAEAAVDSLGVRLEQVRIIIREIQDGHFSVGGEPKFDVFGTGSALSAETAGEPAE